MLRKKKQINSKNKNINNNQNQNNNNLINKNIAKTNLENSKNNEKIYGKIIEENKKINNIGQNTQTVQNIIVKSNINISFINNFNTTYLHKSKKKQKKIRSRNNQELTKLNMVENKIININNNINIDEEINNSKIFGNKIIDNNTTNKNKNNLAPNSNKDIRKKALISPKLKTKENNINGSIKKKIMINNQNIKNKQNIININTKKEKQDKGNINAINKKRISLGNNINKNDNNKKLTNNYIGRVKIHI